MRAKAAKKSLNNTGFPTGTDSLRYYYAAAGLTGVPTAVPGKHGAAFHP